MNDTDAFFTHTIVGAPQTVLLGRRLGARELSAQGLHLNPATGLQALSRAWQDWVVLSHANDPVGLPRQRPGRLRGLLERHALWLALAGLTALLGSAVFWGVQLWN